MPDLRFDSEAHRFVFVKEILITLLRRPHPDVLVFTKSTKHEVSKTKRTLQKTKLTTCSLQKGWLRGSRRRKRNQDQLDISHQWVVCHGIVLNLPRMPSGSEPLIMPCTISPRNGRNTTRRNSTRDRYHLNSRANLRSRTIDIDFPLSGTLAYQAFRSCE